MLTTPQQTRASRAWGLSPGSLASDTGAGPGTKPWRWPYLLALLSWAVYSAGAIWMTIGNQYVINDAMARVADARFMLFSRDPHLAAVGMYWMPLPVIGQLPFMLVLSPLHRAELSGPLACAFAGALAVLVLTRICRSLGLSRPVAIGLTLVYALNPIVVWTAGNGMSEEWSFLGCLIVLLGYIRWCKNHRTLDLATLSFGLTFVMLVRYEGLLLAPLMGLAAAVNDRVAMQHRHGVRPMLIEVRRRLPRFVRVFAVVVLPTYYIFALWEVLQYVIKRDPFYWVTASKASGHTSSGYINLPSHLTLVNIVIFAIGTTLVVCPALAVVGPLLFARRPGTKSLQGVGIVAGALLWPTIIIAGLIARVSTGTTRYFEPAIVFVTVGAAWLAADLQTSSIRLLYRRLGAGALVGVLGISAVWATAGLDNPLRSSQENENFLVGQLFGHKVKPLPRGLDSVANWRALVHDLDPQLARGSKVLIDTAVDYSAFIYTRYPGHYIVDSDRDYLPTLADPANKFDYIVRVSDLLGPGPRETSIDTIIQDTTRGHWVKWRSYPCADVYHFLPDVAGPK